MSTGMSSGAYLTFYLGAAASLDSSCLRQLLCQDASSGHDHVAGVSLSIILLLTYYCWDSNKNCKLLTYFNFKKILIPVSFVTYFEEGQLMPLTGRNFLKLSLLTEKLFISSKCVNSGPFKCRMTSK